MKLIICAPNWPPKPMTTADEVLSARLLRQIIGSSYQEIYPDGFPKNVILLCNASGSYSGLPENGRVYICGEESVIYGTYLVCRQSEDGKHYPLEEEQAQTLLTKLHCASATFTRCCLCGQFVRSDQEQMYPASPLSAGQCCQTCYEGVVKPEMELRADKTAEWKHFCHTCCKHAPPREDCAYCANCPVAQQKAGA